MPALKAFVAMALCAASAGAATDPCALPCQNQNPGNPGYNAAAKVAPCREHSVALFLSFIYWQPIQDFMEVAFKDRNVTTSAFSSLSTDNGTLVEMTSAFKPGMKLGAGYAFPYDDWDVSTVWTWLHSKNGKSASAQPDVFLFTNWIAPAIGTIGHEVERFDYNWLLDFNLVNLELGRRHFVGEKLVIKPFFGAAAVWIGQTFSGNSIGLGSSGLNLTVRMKSNGWGLGPRTGIRGNWYLTKNFSLVGNAAADLLYTHYNLHLNQFAVNNATVFLINSFQLNTFRPEIDLYFGMRWECYFSNSSQHVAVDLGYDFQVWWNQNMNKWFNDASAVSSPQGNLYLQGATFSTEFDF